MEAKTKFVDLLGKGYKAYSVDNKGKKKRRIHEFDVDAGKISIASPMGRSLMGREEGDEFVLSRPKGPATFTVVAIRYERDPDENR